jgi:hypothetical protein
MTQQYFSDDEWSVLVQSPLQAVVALTLSDKTDPVSFLKELQAGVQILSSEQQRQDISNDLVKSLIASLNDLDAKQSLQGADLALKKEFELVGYLRNLTNADEGRQKAIAHFEKVASILASKVTGVQAAEFRAWLLSIAQRVAEAVKEGGFMGIGGEKVSDSERSILKKLEQTLQYQP